jgi:hypothetical protein
MVDRVVFDVELRHTELASQPVGFDERGEARMKAGLRRFNRQQFEIAPPTNAVVLRWSAAR